LVVLGPGVAPPPPPPNAVTITALSPSSGPALAGVFITGTNFTGATSVTFNSVPAVFRVASPTVITTDVPAGATTGSVVVTTPAGTAVSSTAFTVTPPPPPAAPPTITAVIPPSGPVGATRSEEHTSELQSRGH